MTHTKRIRLVRLSSEGNALFRMGMAITTCALFLGGTETSRAAFHLWNVDEIYSNPDGSVQFIELKAGGVGQQNFGSFSGGTAIIAVTNGAVVHTIALATNLPGGTKASTRIVIGTENLLSIPGGVRPNFIIPANFLPLPAAGQRAIRLVDAAG